VYGLWLFGVWVVFGVLRGDFVEECFIVIDGGKAFHSEFSLLIDQAIGHLVDGNGGQYGLKESFDEVIGSNPQFIEIFVIH
jgi:hypothetical protein